MSDPSLLIGGGEKKSSKRARGSDASHIHVHALLCIVSLCLFLSRFVHPGRSFWFSRRIHLSLPLWSSKFSSHSFNSDSTSGNQLSAEQVMPSRRCSCLCVDAQKPSYLRDFLPSPLRRSFQICPIEFFCQRSKVKVETKKLYFNCNTIISLTFFKFVKA